MKKRVDTTIWDKLQLEEGWFSFFALLLAVMTVTWSIESGKWVDGAYLLPRAALAGFLIGFGLSKVRFVPALLAHSFMVSVGMVFVGLLTSPFNNAPFTDWSRRLGSSVLRVVRWTENAIAGNARDDNMVYLVLLGFGLWVLGYAAAWMLFRGHQVWWTLVMLGSVLMINLSFNPPNQFGSFTFFLVISLLLVVRFSAFMDEQRWRSLRLYFQPGIWRGGMAVGGGLVLFIVALAFATPSSSQVDSLGSVLNQVSQPFNGIRGIWDTVGTGGVDGKDGLKPRSKANFNSLDDSFTVGGPLRLNNEPYFRVSGDPNVPLIYLQGKAMNDYDGKTWGSTYQLPVKEKDILPGAATVFRRLSLAANQSLPSPPDRGQYTGRLTLTALVPGFDPVLTLGDLTSLDRQALVAFHYEKSTINAPLTAFKLREITDGNGGKRTILVDETSGKAVPPNALDLVKYLQEAARLDESGYPPQLQATYRSNGPNWVVQYRIGSGRNNNVLSRVNAAPVTVADTAWSYQLPSVDQLRALNLQAGGTPYTNPLEGVNATSRGAGANTASLDSRIYLNSNNEYVVTLESPLAKGTVARDRFEATTLGQKIKAEIKKIEEAVKGNRVSYIMENGRITRLQYEGFEPNYDDPQGAVLPQPLATGESYTTYARRYRADEQSLKRAPVQYPDWVKDRYLRLPATLAPVFKAQAEELTAGLTNPYDKTRALVNYLNSLNYSTDPAPLPEGREEFEYFLSETRSGYCVHFASSLALMLRTIDIPTRVVTGFIGGEYDTVTGTYIVKGSAAHMWTQVYFPGYGWVDFEPTPGREGIQRPPDPSAVPPLPVATPPPAGETAPNPGQDTQEQPDKLPTPTPGKEATTAPATLADTKNEFPYWLLWVAGLTLAGVAIYLGRREYRRRLFSLPDSSPLAVYNRMSQSARQAGLRGRSGMTPFEYSGYLARLLPQAAQPIDAITRTYVQRRYGPNGANLFEEQHRRKLAESQAASARLLEVEKTGHEPGQEDLWRAFKAHSDVYIDYRELDEIWTSYMEAVLDYRRRRRLERLTPAFLRSIPVRLKKVLPKA